MRSFSRFSRLLTLDMVLGKFKAFRRYTELYIRRLRGRHCLSDEEERAIEGLEWEFDFDMILLLRAKARKAAEVDDALYLAGGGGSVGLSSAAKRHLIARKTKQQWRMLCGLWSHQMS